MTARAVRLLACVGALLGGCAVEVPFDCAWRLPVGGPPGAQATAVPMDLSAQEALWAQRDAIEEVRAERVRVTVVRVGPRNHAAGAKLAVRYRPEGAPESGELDVPVLDALELPMIAGAVAEVPPGAELGSALEETLRGSGRFTLVFWADVDGIAEAEVELSLAGTAVATP